MPRVDPLRKTKTETCDCPVCTGLVCLDRPRYFAGQLLTEAELNSEQAYLLGKNRLHNRYLHGYGIVCGLQVSCHDCDGWVTVHSGYALDACGNDIIVCDAQDFDLIKAIRSCRETYRQERECDPWREPNRNRCQDVEEDWCITLRYREKEGKPTTALTTCSPSSCGCGRPGHARNCGCSGTSTGASSGKTSSQMMLARPAAPIGACEPSRIIEGFELGVMPAPRLTGDNTDTIFLDRLVEALQKLGLDLDITCLVECFTSFQEFAQRLVAIRNLLQQNPFGAAQTIYRDLCRLRSDLRDYLLNEPRTHCALLDQLAAVFCPPPPTTDNDTQTFVAQVGTALDEIGVVLQTQFIDCVCYEALPTCPPEACEDRLVLACVTVRGDQIIRICHSGVRRYVLTPHNALSLVLNYFLEQVCCVELRREAPGRFTNAADFTNATVAEAAFRSRAVGAAANFINFGRNVAGGENVSEAASAFRRAEGLDPATMVGRPADEVRAGLGERFPVREEVTVRWTPAESLLHTLEAPAVREGDQVRLYVDEAGKVVGLARISAAEGLRRDLDEANRRIVRLEEQLNRVLRSQRKGGTANA